MAELAIGLIQKVHRFIKTKLLFRPPPCIIVETNFLLRFIQLSIVSCNWCTVLAVLWDLADDFWFQIPEMRNDFRFFNEKRW